MANPNTPIHPQENRSFYGRQTELAWLAERLSHNEPVLIVYGSRYIGKSALLRQFVTHPPYGYLGIYLDGAQTDDMPVAELLIGIANQFGDLIQEKSGVMPERPSRDDFAQDPLSAWHTYLNTIARTLDGRKIVLAVDHAHRAAPQILETLFKAGLTTILAVDHPVQFTSQGHPLPPAIRLGPLDNQAAEALVKELIVAQASVDPWIVRRIIQITSGHPHYIRQFCDHLVVCCTLRPQINPTDVEEALATFLDTPIPEFEATWNALSPLQKALLATFSALRGQGGISTQYDLEKACTRRGKSIPLEQIVDTLNTLAQSQILEKLGTNSYRFQLELFRLWLRAHYSPDELLHRRFKVSPAQGTLVARLSERWPLWTSIGAILIVMVIVALQPAWWNFRQQTPAPTATRTTAPVLVSTPDTPTTIAATTTPVPMPTATLAGYDLLIMSRAKTDKFWQIYALNSNTGQRLRLTETDSNERTPKWSPDGRRILFTSERDGNREVYIMNADGSETINLTQHPSHDWQPAWSPDGTRIVFSSYRDENWEIYLFNADGSGLVRLTEHPESDFSPTWSPDGQKILFASRRNGNADLFALDLESRKLTQLTHSKQDEYDPAWSPDGEWIAFTTLIDEQSDIFVMHADGSNPVNLTNSRYANDFQPAWTQYSEAIIFVSYTAADGDHDLFRIRRDGRELARLTDDPMDNISPCWRYTRP